MTNNEESQQLLQRRLQAGQLLACGMRQAEVARRVGASRTAVSEWNARLAAGGLQALQPRRRGRPPALDAGQRQALMQALKGEAHAHGFATRVWTLPQVRWFIEREFGKRYSTSQVRRILKALRVEEQRRLARALEHNDSVVRKWNRQRRSALRRMADMLAASPAPMNRE